MRQFDALLRQGLMDANLAQYENVLERADGREADFSPRYRRERMRLLADPWGWERRQPERRPRRKRRTPRSRCRSALSAPKCSDP